MNRLFARTLAIVASGLLVAPSLPCVLALNPVTEIEDSTPIWQWVATALMAIVCGFVVFLNAKRSHQG